MTASYWTLDFNHKFIYLFSEVQVLFGFFRRCSLHAKNQHPWCETRQLVHLQHSYFISKAKIYAKSSRNCIRVHVPKESWMQRQSHQYTEDIVDPIDYLVYQLIARSFSDICINRRTCGLHNQTLDHAFHRLLPHHSADERKSNEVTSTCTTKKSFQSLIPDFLQMSMKLSKGRDIMYL